jgi:hypothetical protein
MGFVESLRSIIYDILHNLDRIHVDLIKSNGLNPLRIRHDSGGLLEFRNDGEVYCNGIKIGDSSSFTVTENFDMNGYNIVEADSIIADTSHDLTLTVDTGQAFVFSKV